MIHPSQVTAAIAPPILADSGLLGRTRHWGFARGALRPHVVVDPAARFQNGYRGFLAHEALHCLERHVFWTVLVASVTFGTFAMFLLWAPILGGEAGRICFCAGFGALGGGALYLGWWTREREIRADAFALEDVGITGFYAFLLMVGHPAVADGPAHGPLGFARRLWLRTYRRWLRWVYGRTINDRVARAAKRRARLRWPPLSVSSRSESSAAPAVPPSRSPAPASPKR